MDRRYDTLLAQVRRRGGFGDRADAERAVKATTQVLGARLNDVETRALAEELPEPLSEWLREPDHTGEFSVDELVELVRRTEGVAHGFAREHILVVGEALGEIMSRDARVRLAHRLGDDWAGLFAPRDSRSGGVPARSHHARRSNFAEGRPGSSHPLSESAPHREQSHSVASEDNPRADRKLSSGAEGDDLARGRPRTSPISGE